MTNDAYERVSAGQFLKASFEKKAKDACQRRRLKKRLREVHLQPDTDLGTRVHAAKNMGDWYRKQSLEYAQRPSITPNELAAQKATASKKQWRARVNAETDLARQLYQKYLQTPHWKTFSAQTLIDRGWKCEYRRCSGNCGRLHVHHLRYTNLGHERPEDVIVVGEKCHLAIHARRCATHIDHKHLSRLLNLAK